MTGRSGMGLWVVEFCKLLELENTRETDLSTLFLLWVEELTCSGQGMRLVGGWSGLEGRSVALCQPEGSSHQGHPWSGLFNWHRRTCHPVTAVGLALGIIVPTFGPSTPRLAPPEGTSESGRGRASRDLGRSPKQPGRLWRTACPSSGAPGAGARGAARPFTPC